jgi:hypothetical protein
MTWVTVAVGVGTSVAGAGVGMYAQHQQASRQDEAAAAGINRQNLLRSQANADVNKNIVQAKSNSANIAKNQTAEQQQYTAALARAAGVQGGAITDQPGASKRYATDVAASRANVGQFGQDLAARTAAVDAPQITNLQTQLGLGDTATKLGMLSDTSSNQQNLTNMQVKGIIANPWLLAAGDTLKGAGAAYAGSAFKGKVPEGVSPGIQNAINNPSVYG